MLTRPRPMLLRNFWPLVYLSANTTTTTSTPPYPHLSKMSTSTPSSSTAAQNQNKPLLNPSTFPRPPKLERVNRLLEIYWQGLLLASTRDGYWVLETWHPPTYYLPRSSLQPIFAEKLTRNSGGSSFCEWKGAATYWDLSGPSVEVRTASAASADAGASTGEGDGGKEVVVRRRIWSYENPTQGFVPIKDYLSFYAGPWQCFVDGEEVIPQPGDFYGGWTTSDIDTKYVKGAPGTRHW